MISGSTCDTEDGWNLSIVRVDYRRNHLEVTYDGMWDKPTEEGGQYEISIYRWH